MTPFEQTRVLHPFAIVCASDVQFRTYLRWKGLEEWDSDRVGDGVRRAVKITSSAGAQDYTRAHGKPGRTLVVILPLDHMPAGILPRLEYRRRPPVEKPAEEEKKDGPS
jgi:hypothetical protein